MARENHLANVVGDWQRRLLQLDRRNNLLYFRPGKSAVHITNIDADEIFYRLSTSWVRNPEAEIESIEAALFKARATKNKEPQRQAAERTPQTLRPEATQRADMPAQELRSEELAWTRVGVDVAPGFPPY